MNSSLHFFSIPALAPGRSAGGRAGPKVDYREVPSEADFAVFATLRNQRASQLQGPRGAGRPAPNAPRDAACAAGLLCDWHG